MLSERSQLLRNHLLSTHLLVASKVPGRECGWRMSKRWVRHSACAPGTHSLMTVGTLACWQVVPGISYGIMTGKEEKEHLESPGDTFNLAVLPTSTRRFFSARSPATLFPLFLALPLFPLGLWSLAVGLSEGCGHCFPGWVISTHPHTQSSAPSLKGTGIFRLSSCLGKFIYLFILKRLKSENSYLYINGSWHSFLKHKDTVNF